MQILRNIDNSIKIVKLVSLIVILAAFGFSAYIYTYAMNQIEANREKVYLLNNGNALELVRSRNLNENITAEVKNHISMFHEFFFNLDPDGKDIKLRINRALNLIDESGKLLESQRNEAMYYHKLVDGGITSRIQIDSISVQENKSNYLCKIYARQKLERSTKIIYKNLISECRVRQTSRTESNPHGLIIENYNMIDNNNTHEESK